MALNRGTQKQIAQRFKGNLDYFRKPHYWRRLRFWSILAIVLLGTAAMAFFYGWGRDSIYNPGKISRHHAHFEQDCGKCHEPFKKTLAGVSLKLSNESIDERCATCHAGFAFHQPNVTRDHSCTACHQEHRGSGAIAAPPNGQCLSCHGDAHVMAASAEKGRGIEPAKFDYRPSLGRVIFKTPRPGDGFTAVMSSFEKDHPEFRVRVDNLREPNTLKFNHRRHLVETNDIPLVNGKRIDCAFCHQPAPGGEFFQRVSFENNCRVCHSLQFDDRNPELELPHGRSEHVRAFLRSLPTHYADLASRRGHAAQSAVNEFVTAQMTRLRDLANTGENFEQQVFFNARRQTPDGRAKFEGCALCHEVNLELRNSRTNLTVPAITPPILPDRWMIRAHFDHAKHANVDCRKCHDALRSADTADIIMPGKAACVECHSAKGKVANNCSFCHGYHAPGRFAIREL